MNEAPRKIILPGGAGLVGQNLVTRLRAAGWGEIVVIDKHHANLAVLKRHQPEITAVCADLAEPGIWHRHFAGAGAIVMLQAQIGGNDQREFVRNNITATRLVLAAGKANRVPYLVHVSSSVVTSGSADLYTTTKQEQERMVLASGIPGPVLRPTLMFGWFDRKHLGWLARFMRRVPVFPVPGDGRYPRQPLYAGDFCNIIVSCLRHEIPGGTYNISGHEAVDYIDIIREVKQATGAGALIVNIPYRLFAAALRVWGMFDRNPPFTAQQLAALSARDAFEVIDWPRIFNVPCTPFAVAVAETFSDATYSKITLEF